jgi:hypothetical protein
MKAKSAAMALVNFMFLAAILSTALVCAQSTVRIEATPDTQTHLIGEAATIRITFYNNSAPVSKIMVLLEVSGNNTYYAAGSTGTANPYVDLSYSGTKAGTDNVTASTMIDDVVYSDSVIVVWTTETKNIPDTSASVSPNPTPTPSVPEFSWLIILPLFLSIFSIAVLIRKRKCW